MKLNQLLIIAIVVFMVFSGFLFLRNRSLSTTLNRTNSNIEALNSELKHYKLKNGDLVAEKGMLKSTLDELKILNKGLYDTLRYYEKELEMKINTINNLRMSAKTNVVYDTIKDTLFYEDGILSINLEAEEKDSVLSLKTFVELSIAVDCENLKHEIRQSKVNTDLSIDNLRLTIISGYRRKNIFRRKKQYISNVIVDDDRFSITDFESWTDAERKPYFSINPGLFAGLVYNPFAKDFEFGVGLGIGLNFNR